VVLKRQILSSCQKMLSLRDGGGLF